MPACQDPNYQNYTYAILDLLNFRQMILNIIESDTEITYFTDSFHASKSTINCF